VGEPAIRASRRRWGRANPIILFPDLLLRADSALMRKAGVTAGFVLYGAPSRRRSWRAFLYGVTTSDPLSWAA